MSEEYEVEAYPQEVLDMFLQAAIAIPSAKNVFVFQPGQVGVTSAGVSNDFDQTKFWMFMDGSSGTSPLIFQGIEYAFIRDFEDEPDDLRNKVYTYMSKTPVTAGELNGVKASLAVLYHKANLFIVVQGDEYGLAPSASGLFKNIVKEIEME